MYAGRVECCPLVSHDEYADRTDIQTDGRHTVTLRFPQAAASVVMQHKRSAAALPLTSGLSPSVTNKLAPTKRTRCRMTDRSVNNRPRRR